MGTPGVEKAEMSPGPAAPAIGVEGWGSSDLSPRLLTAAANCASKL